MVINARTFKTFDGLLDALAKKVPLPFGVRTITTPRGTNLVKALDDLHDGGSYVCSDNKRVKPLNLDEVNRRQVPWNATRPLSGGRRRRKGSQFGPFGGRNEVVTGRPAKITERGAVRTPKRLVVIRNRDPIVKRTIVLQRRTAPTFDALLDYLSQILQFPVLKLFSTDGRRIDGLAGLILCSGGVVAAGNEPFRLGNYNFHGESQMAQGMDTMEPSMLPPKSHGSMTVEMKVRLTIKEEEMLHWTTTLSRSSRSKGIVCASISESGNSSLDSNNGIAKDSSSASEDETREEDHPAGPERCVDFHDQQAYEGYDSMASGKAQNGFKRAPTPGPRHVTKKTSVESVKTVTESGVQESTLGHYSYRERTADGEKTEGYCIVRRSSSNNKPIPKPRKTAARKQTVHGIRAAFFQKRL
ncbi:Oxygen-regulated protein 1 [Liparis tanakae]|uniref:Oxygen-regulated protein 1 n=1 Tax=Liparis tanakae TaxID=230148 RepID=A0A4Z2IM41_9TELE|nr:Oxygen-regulated protein 1 [Liparis tanakae]